MLKPKSIGDDNALESKRKSLKWRGVLGGDGKLVLLQLTSLVKLLRLGAGDNLELQLAVRASSNK